jgi:hypothetical protein
MFSNGSGVCATIDSAGQPIVATTGDPTPASSTSAAVRAARSRDERLPG